MAPKVMLYFNAQFFLIREVSELQLFFELRKTDESGCMYICIIRVNKYRFVREIQMREPNRSPYIYIYEPQGVFACASANLIQPTEP